MRRGTNHVWRGVVVVLFCLPLFVGLGSTDLKNDEPIYSFAVDRMLETGDWLVPKSIPNEDSAFLEKPPLKFWIVAAPIRLGLLPHDEFGLRFWDALFGGIAFLYVFAIGCRLAGPACGAAAVLILFVHHPLLFEHGLRSNNMEAALVLCYCGGVYHYLAWTGSEGTGARRRHVLATALYFVLGFMTKFVAALFLPLVLGVASLLIGTYRAKLARDRRLWLGAGGLALAAIAPWFLYAWLKFGSLLWDVILGQHVYVRFRAFLDPQHVQPWYHYFSSAYRELKYSHCEVIVGIGLLLLVVQTVRRRWPEGLVILLWSALPVALMSFGTSKLYHYLYPFLPPLALAGGYVPALLLAVFQGRLGGMADDVDHRLARAGNRLLGWLGQPPARVVLMSIAAMALAVAVATLVLGSIRLELGGWVLLRNAGIVRPLLVAVTMALLAGQLRRVRGLLMPLLVLGILPTSTYRERFPQLSREDHPIRTMRECLAQHRLAGVPEGVIGPRLYLDEGLATFPYPVYYYLRQLRSWEIAERPSDPALYERLYIAGRQQPVFLTERRYKEFMARMRASSPGFVDEVAQGVEVSPAEIRERAGDPGPRRVRFYDVLMLLPGPYASCAVQPTHGDSGQ